MTDIAALQAMQHRCDQVANTPLVGIRIIGGEIHTREVGLLERLVHFVARLFFDNPEELFLQTRLEEILARDITLLLSSQDLFTLDGKTDLTEEERALLQALKTSYLAMGNLFASSNVSDTFRNTYMPAVRTFEDVAALRGTLPSSAWSLPGCPEMLDGFTVFEMLEQGQSSSLISRPGLVHRTPREANHLFLERPELCACLSTRALSSLLRRSRSASVEQKMNVIIHSTARLDNLPWTPRLVTSLIESGHADVFARLTLKELQHIPEGCTVRQKAAILLNYQGQIDGCVFSAEDYAHFATDENITSRYSVQQRVNAFRATHMAS
ncbi:MAG: hypothetical protein SP1CHLAM54_02310 [Chlamydiia bacterium]|nr:hypothetical protein [Chlamydiia bacterium]MCH9615148.1 hypothetical protein [Chlamydiia bacterium]MCH9628530.1 hypothetical protein [Chlamydiia bacterium]